MTADDAADHHRDRASVSFIDALGAIAAAAGPDGFTIGEIVDRLDERAFGLLILAFAIPCLVPGLPGAQIIAIPILLLALQVALGRREPWLPRWVMGLRARKDWLAAIAGFMDKRLRWSERLSRPRLGFLASGAGERLAAVIAALAAVTIMLPITNTLPSLAITLIAVGLIQRDGAFTGLGALLALGWVGLLSALIGGLLFGAGFAIAIVQERAPWLLDWLQGASP